MWWLAISLGSLFVCPLAELVEAHLARRSSRKDLAAMKQHSASGHRWDVLRGQWTA
jgi:hypothetical protein